MKPKKLAGLLLLWTCLTTPLAAIAPMGVPDVPLVPVQAGAAAPAQMSAALFPSTGQQLLVLVTPDSPESLVLLGILNNLPPELTATSRIVIVVEDRDMEHALLFKNLFPQLTALPWFSDESRSMRAALQLKEVPIALGIRDGKTQWSISGLTSDLMVQKSALLGWIAPGPNSPPAPPPTTSTIMFDPRDRWVGLSLNRWGSFVQMEQMYS